MSGGWAADGLGRRRDVASKSVEMENRLYCREPLSFSEIFRDVFLFFIVICSIYRLRLQRIMCVEFRGRHTLALKSRDDECYNVEIQTILQINENIDLAKNNRFSV